MQKCNEFNEGIIKLAIIEYIRKIYGFCDFKMEYGSDSGSRSYEILFYSVCIAL